MNAKLHAIEPSNTSSPSPLKQEQKIIEYLTKHYFVISDSGGNTNYYDSLHDVRRGVNKYQLRDVTYHLLEKYPDAYTDDKANLLKWIDNLIDYKCFFRSVILDKDYYRPFKPAVINQDGRHYPNLWKPSKVLPVYPPCDVQPFCDFLRTMMGSQEKVDYFLNLLAYKYQNRNTCHLKKPHVAVYLYGEQGGMGKSSFVGGVIKEVFGQSAVTTVLDESKLESGSSVDVWRKEWLIVEEVRKRVDSNLFRKIKGFTGQSTTESDRKNAHFATYEIPANLMMFSNSPPTFLEQNDRRFFVSKFQHNFKSPEFKDEYFNRFDNWLKNKGGYQAIASLLEQKDISDFNIASSAMMTDEKRDVLLSISCPVIAEIQYEMRCKPEKPFWSAEEFYHLMIPNRLTLRSLNHKLREAGLIALDGRQRWKESTRHRNEVGIKVFLRDGNLIERAKGTTPELITASGSHKLYEHKDWISFFSYHEQKKWKPSDSRN